MVLGVVMAGLAAYQLAHVLMLVFASVLVAVLLTALADGVERVTRLPRAAAMAVHVHARVGRQVDAAHQHDDRSVSTLTKVEP